MRVRQGFTLVELLVVVAIIGILVALLFLAVQTAREAGRRVTCANHLKQFALAVANYSAANDDSLPPIAMEFFGSRGQRPLQRDFPCDSWSRNQSPSWRVAVLPFLEEQGLYDQVDFSQGVVSQANRAVASQVLSVYQCPSTPGYPRSVRQSDWGISKRVLESLDGLFVGSWDYGVPASSWDVYSNGRPVAAVPPAWNGAKDPWRVSNGERPGGTCGWKKVYGRRARLSWVMDGLSKTSAAYEIAYRPNLFSRQGLTGWSDGQELSGNTWIRNHGSGWVQSQYVDTFPPVFKPINTSNRGGATGGKFAFHPAGVNEAFLDGSVRFLDESTGVAIQQAMASRAGGETENSLNHSN